MSNYEVEQPILNSPYKEPLKYWQIEAGRPPEIRSGRVDRQGIFTVIRRRR